jgi:hypothetical protein
VAGLFLSSALSAQVPGEIDSVVSWPWRCFVAFENGRPTHHSFVEMRPDGPHLFRAQTVAERRRTGIFSHVVRRVAVVLLREGHGRLTSSTEGRNGASLAAHAAAGFTVVSRRREILVLGVSLGRILRRQKRS